MPFTINEEAAKSQQFLNVMNPQEVARQKPDGAWQSTMGGGLPVKQIPHMEFPLVLYKHPKKAFREIVHRNDRFEVVSTDLVPTEHLTKHVHNETELKEALAKGWRKEPYIPQAPPRDEDDIYGEDAVEPDPLPPAPKRSTRGTKENPL